MASSVTKEMAKLDGVVRYTVETNADGQTELSAKWVSSRIVSNGQAGFGRAVRQEGAAKSEEGGFGGNWIVKYYDAEGVFQVTPFLLDLERTGELYQGRWADPEGRPLLEGFGFVDDGKLYMRYGEPR